MDDIDKGQAQDLENMLKHPGWAIMITWLKERKNTYDTKIKLAAVDPSLNNDQARIMAVQFGVTSRFIDKLLQKPHDLIGTVREDRDGEKVLDRRSDQATRSTSEAAEGQERQADTRIEVEGDRKEKRKGRASGKAGNNA